MGKALRKCMDCSLEAFTEDDLKLFSVSRCCLYDKANLCLTCGSLRTAKKRQTKDGFIKNLYTNQKHNANTKLKRHGSGHYAPKYTRKELHDWLMAQPLFHHLFHLYKVSGFDRMLAPSVDRIDDYDGYTFSNIQLMTWKENRDKGHADVFSGTNSKSTTKVVQFTKDGEELATYNSLALAERATGVARQDIYKVAKGKRNYAGGFIWKYKKDL